MPGRQRLNLSIIDAIPIPGKGYTITRDADLPGFGVRVTAAGARSYVVFGRVNGVERRVTLSSTDRLSPDEARKQARKMLGKFASGDDPVIEREKSVREGVTLGDAFEVLLIERTLKPLTVRDMRRAMNDLAWSKRRIRTITPDLVGTKHKELGKASHARANLTMRYLRAILNFASEHYAAEDGTPFLSFNPVGTLSKKKSWYPVKRRQTHIVEAELEPWMQAVLQVENGDIRDYLMLVLLTGLRRTEALGLKWVDVSLRAKTLTIPDPKNSEAHTLPLTDYLQEMMERRNGSRVGDLVFESERGALSNLRYAMATVQNISGVKFCIHDLRRTFATVAERLDTPAYAVKQLMNHKNKGDVTQGYIIRDVERLRRPMQRITDYFLTAGGVRVGAEIVELLERRKASR